MKHLISLYLIASAVVAAVACDRGTMDEGAFGTFGSGSAVTSTSAADETASPMPLDIGSSTPPSCGPIDFLFVLDTSVSMQNEINALHDAIPALLFAIGDGDHRVMAVDSDQWKGVECDARCDDPVPDGCVAENGVDCVAASLQCENSLCPFWNPCWDDPGFSCVDPQPTACVDVLGGGQTFECGTVSPAWVSVLEDGLPAVDCVLASFEGTAYTTERPMGALVGALEMQETCSDGFLREDAFLVIVVLTDEPDQSAGDPGTWLAAVGAVRPEMARVAVVALLRDPESSDCYGDSPRIREWAFAFEHGIVAPICADYTGVFAEAANMVNAACTEG